MSEKDSILEQNVHETGLIVDKILEEAYQRCGETEDIKRPEQDEPIEELT